MKRFVLMALLAATVASHVHIIAVRADESAEKAAARKVTEAWLALVDAGKYGQSWEEASELFRKQVTKEQWEGALNGVRSPLGKVGSRVLSSAEYKTTVPGAPDGEYVICQFQSSFEKKKSATETVSSMKDSDGKWRVSGYFIK